MVCDAEGDDDDSGLIFVICVCMIMIVNKELLVGVIEASLSYTCHYWANTQEWDISELSSRY